LSDEGTNNQGEFGGNPEGILVHQFGEIIGNSAEIEVTDPLTDGIA
jgi:hypothetical protein